jgi:hypothetical protein
LTERCISSFTTVSATHGAEISMSSFLLSLLILGQRFLSDELEQSHGWTHREPSVGPGAHSNFTILLNFEEKSTK